MNPRILILKKSLQKVLARKWSCPLIFF